MKRTLILGMISLGLSVATSYGQGYVALDNYSSGNNTYPITYGANVPANGVSGALGTVGGGISSAWTVGFYWASGATGLSQASGMDPISGTLALATGPGSTVAVDTQNSGTPGFYASEAVWYAGSAISTITLEIVVYPTAAGSYASAAYRIHSAAFSMATGAITTVPPLETGDSMPGAATLAVLPAIPEPAAMALGGLGLAALLLFRRKQA